MLVRITNREDKFFPAGNMQEHRTVLKHSLCHQNVYEFVGKHFCNNVSRGGNTLFDKKT